MGDFNSQAFQSLVHDFLDGRRTWDDVHKFVIEAEWSGADTPTHLTNEHRDAIDELRMAFLADAKDDPQFLLSKVEVKALLDRLETVQRR
jgi:hypothetical protein